MSVTQTLHEINGPSHLPWQLARLGRCVLAVDKSGESPGLTGHTPRQVANNVSGKAQICAFVFLLSVLWSCSHIQDSIALQISHSQSFIFTFTLLYFTLSALFPLLLTCFFLMLGDDTVRRPRLIRAHPGGGRM